MDQPVNQHGYVKPIGGFVVVLFVAIFVGGWLYVDAVRNELEMKIAVVQSQLDAVRMAQKQDAQEPKAPMPDEKMRPPTPDGWKTAEGDGYLVDLPPGYQLVVGTNGYDYIHADPLADDNLLPYAVIVKLSASQEAEYADEGGRLLLSGDAMYWMYLYENLEWKEFDQAAASLRTR